MKFSISPLSIFTALAWAMLGGTGTCLPGCMTAEDWAGLTKPQTSISFSPITRTLSVTNTKDVTIHAEGLESEATPDGQVTKFNLAKLDIIDNASSVIDANIAQIQAAYESQKLQIEMQKQLGANMAIVLEQFNQIVQSLAPVLIRYAPQQAPTTTGPPATTVITNPGTAAGGG